MRVVLFLLLPAAKAAGCPVALCAPSALPCPLASCLDATLLCHSHSNSTCTGHACFTAGNLTGCAAAPVAGNWSGIHTCLEPLCNHPDFLNHTWPNPNISVSVNESSHWEDYDYGDLLIDALLSGNDSVGNETVKKTDRAGVWRRHRTIGGIAIFFVLLLTILALAICFKYIWSKVLKRDCSCLESHCPDPSIFWKLVGRHQPGSSERSAAYFSNGHVHFDE